MTTKLESLELALKNALGEGAAISSALGEVTVVVKAADYIKSMQALRDDLGSCIGCGCLSMRRCALSNPTDTAGGAGATGAAYLPAALRRG